MEKRLKHAIFNTKLGWVGILSSSRGILATTLPQATPAKARQQLGLVANGQEAAPPKSLAGLVENLVSYYHGQRAEFTDKLNIPLATPFQRQVWRATQTIPYGETRTYQWVAERIGKPGAARAVGQALARNPLPVIVPCHRILASNGRLGGFSGGLEMKKRLLRLEANAEG